MTDRFRRQKNRRRRRLIALLALAVFSVWRFSGPGIAVIRTASLEPMLRSGDVVFMARTRSRVAAGDTVSWRPPGGGRRFGLSAIIDRFSDGTRDDDPAGVGGPVQEHPVSVPRIVIASAGDQVSWNDRNVTVHSGEQTRRYTFSPLHSRLTSAVRQVRLRPDELFVVSLEPGRIDSRIVGPVDVNTVRFRITRIMWPANRRNRVNANNYLENPR